MSAIRQQLIELLEECLHEHRVSDHDTLVLKSVIEDEEIQQILREIMESHGADQLRRATESEGGDEQLEQLIERLKSRQREVLSELGEK